MTACSPWTHQHIAPEARALDERQALGGFGRLHAVDTRRPRRAQGRRRSTGLHLLLVSCVSFAAAG